MAEDAPSRHRNELGGAGNVARRNLKALRAIRQVSTTQLSKLLGSLGRPIQPTGITKIEAGDRRIDVDDLIALSVALDVPPHRVFLPADDPNELVNLTPNAVSDAADAWRWASGQGQLFYGYTGPEEDRPDRTQFVNPHGAPAWSALARSHQAYIDAQLLLVYVERYVLMMQSLDMSGGSEIAVNIQRDIEHQLAAVGEAINQLRAGKRYGSTQPSDEE